MILTEEEALTKWCPFALVAGGHVSDRGNRWPADRLGDEGTVKPMARASFCLASGCMAWRHLVGNAGKGYCGLGGKP